MCDPIDGRYAFGSRPGTWYSEPGKEGLCPLCGGSQERRIPPLLIRWERGPKLVGDFTWPGAGASDIAVTDRVWRQLLADYRDLSVEPVMVITKKESTLHPDLKDLWLPGPYQLDLVKSTVTKTFSCDLCDREKYEITGYEYYSVRWDKVTRTGSKVHEPRLPDSGIFIASTQLNDHHIFRIKEQPNWALCTDMAKNDMENRGYTNIRFLEVGTVI